MSGGSCWRFMRRVKTSSYNRSVFYSNLGDSRFLPYIQLHEFEALLYCDLSQLQQRIADSERAFAALAGEVRRRGEVNSSLNHHNCFPAGRLRERARMFKIGMEAATTPS